MSHSNPRPDVPRSRERLRSAVLHALLDAHTAHERAGTVLVLAGPLHVSVRRLFEVTGTGPALRMADSLEAAITW
ncbi:MULTISPECIES: hypothetical protein [unclassified Streptomyces]|uniref:hypothetical protein n=1 Tax=unclassified Streptomyces TaxID=2593676 RepID=UPI002D1E399A|nr:MULTISPECIES: hypothetical protein [unclassified Streptomyces]